MGPTKLRIFGAYTFSVPLLVVNGNFQFQRSRSDRNYFHWNYFQYWNSGNYKTTYSKCSLILAWARILSDFGEINGKILNFGEINGKILKFRGLRGSEFQDEISMNFTPWNFLALKFRITTQFRPVATQIHPVATQFGGKPTQFVPSSKTNWVANWVHEIWAGLLSHRPPL